VMNGFGRNALFPHNEMRFHSMPQNRCLTVSPQAYWQ
jgi:hypothetical protein